MSMVSSSHWEHQRHHELSDVLIVGAGFVGLWTAWHWLQRHPKGRIHLVDRLPSMQAGASTRNAGFACFGSPTELLEDLAHEPEDDIIERLHQRYMGLQQWRSTFSAADLDWKDALGHEVFSPDQKDGYQRAVAALDHLNTLAHRADIPGNVYRVAEGFSPQLPHAISIRHEAGLHPGKAYAQLTHAVLAAGARIHRGVPLPPKSEWTYEHGAWRIPSPQGVWMARNVVVASNSWAHLSLPQLDIVPGRGQVLFTDPISNLPFQGTYHADAGYLYFRNVGDRLLLGGGRNQFRAAEETHDAQTSDEVQAYLENYLHTVLLPGFRVNIAERWAGTMAFSSDQSKKPYLEDLGDQTYVAARMGGMGVALAPELGLKMAALLSA